MSTINTSISLNSTTTFPSVNVTSLKNFSSDKTTFGTIKVSSEVMFVPLSTEDCGTQGAYIYAKAPLSNPAGVGVELTGVEQAFNAGDSSPFATLYPGDIALIPLSPSQLSVIATTTTGEECTLEYSYSSRGANFGENLVVFSGQGGYWTFSLLDANYGKASIGNDTGISTSDFGFLWDSAYVQDKGYVFVFYNGTNSLIAVMIDTHGNSFSTNPFVDYNLYSINGDEQVSSSVVIQFNDGSDWNNFYIFDGVNFHIHHFPEYYSSISVIENDNILSSDGSILFIGQRYDTVINDVILINGEKKYKIYNYSYDSENDPTIIFSTQDSNNAIIFGKSSDDGQIISVTVADTQGNILHSSPFNVDLHNTGLYIDNIYTYAGGKFLTVLFDSQYYYFINYDPSTNTLVGGDLSWKYLRSYYSGYNVYFHGTNAYTNDADSAFHEDSIRIDLFSSLAYDSYLANSYYYPQYSAFAVTYLIPGMKEPGFYEFWDGINGDKPYIYYSSVERGGTRNKIAIVYTNNPEDGSLYQLTLTPTQQIVDTITTNVTEYFYFEFYHFTDDYSFYAFGGNTGNTNEKYVIHKLGTGKTNNIVDTLILPLNHQSFSYTSFYTDYGLLLISHLDTGRIYYFNSTTNKLTQFVTSLGYSYVIDSRGFDVDIRNRNDNNSYGGCYVPGDISDLGNVFLDTTTGLMYYFYNNKLVSSSTTPLPAPIGDWFTGIGNGTYVYIYFNGTSFIVNIYGLTDLKLIRSIDTGFDNVNYVPNDNGNNKYYGICNNRIYFASYTENGPKIKMISSTGAVQEIDYVYGDYFVNDTMPFNY